jgi:hypothetical protein
MQQSCRGLLSRAQVGAFTAHQSAFLLGPGRRIRGSVNWNSNVVVNALDLGLELDLTSAATFAARAADGRSCLKDRIGVEQDPLKF